MIWMQKYVLQKNKLRKYKKKIKLFKIKNQNYMISLLNLDNNNLIKKKTNSTKIRWRKCNLNCKNKKILMKKYNKN